LVVQQIRLQTLEQLVLRARRQTEPVALQELGEAARATRVRPPPRAR
jgi:hypothetical protein